MLARMLLTPRVMTVKRGVGDCVLMPTPSSVNSAVIARSDSDEAIQYFAKQESLDCFASLAMTASPSKQTQLLPVALRLGEMIGGQFGAALVETELLAGDFETASDHPGHRAGAFHPHAPLRVVVAAAAHVADQREDVAITVGIVRHQPFAKQIANFQRQPQQDVA